MRSLVYRGMQSQYGEGGRTSEVGKEERVGTHLGRPSLNRERPQSRREPRIEDVLILLEDELLAGELDLGARLRFLQAATRDPELAAEALLSKVRVSKPMKGWREGKNAHPARHPPCAQSTPARDVPTRADARCTNPGCRAASGTTLLRSERGE
mgnify:CR=1 FL=1